MQRFFVLVVFSSFIVLLRAQAQGPDDQYVSIYNLIQEADALKGAEPAQALAKYLEAQAGLQQLQHGYPDWNARVVNFRLSYLASKIAELSPKVPSAMAAQPLSPNSVEPPLHAASAPRAAPATVTQSPVTPPSKAAVPSSNDSPAAPTAPPGALENQAAALRSQVSQLQGEKALLEAKLKEALAAQPAAVDPRELARAEEQVKALQKENDSLKASLAQEKSNPAALANAKSLDAARQALAQSNAKLKEQTERADLLALQKEALQNQFTNLQRASRTAPPPSDAARKALDDANRKLAQETALANQLAADKHLLETRLTKADSQAEAAAALLLENQVLKKQLGELKAAPPPAVLGEHARHQLALAQAQIATLESDKQLLHLEKVALENRIKQSSGPAVASAPPPAPSRPADSARIKELEQEQDNLKHQLALALQQAKGRRDRAAEARVKEMEKEVATLRSRLTVFEAKRIPYSAEELALFHQPAPQLATPSDISSPIDAQSNLKSDPKADTKSVSEPPAGSATLVAEAHRYFASRQFDKAEERYLQVLRQDDKNVYTLANLAAIQLELNHLEEANQHVLQALAVAPGDAYSLLILGQVKLRQEKYDDSIDALSRAAKSDPENAQVQNFLGVALSHKGLRIAAETALRRAIELDPGYASAHNNLAVVYVTQQPPAVALARWHYQKALAAGQPRNPDLEKMLETPLTADTGK